MPTLTIRIMCGRGTHIQMSGQSRACRRPPEATSLSDPERQPANRHYARKDQTYLWVRADAGQPPLSLFQKAATSESDRRLRRLEGMK